MTALSDYLAKTISGWASTTVAERSTSHSWSTPTWSAHWKRWRETRINLCTYQQHKVFNIGYAHCSYDNSLSKYCFRRGNDCIAWFIEEFRNLTHKVNTVLSTNVPMPDFTRDDWQKFDSTTHCHVCEKPFALNDTLVCDHCHLMGRFRGLAHSKCNLNYTAYL